MRIRIDRIKAALKAPVKIGRVRTEDLYTMMGGMGISGWKFSYGIFLKWPELVPTEECCGDPWCEGCGDCDELSYDHIPCYGDSLCECGCQQDSDFCECLNHDHHVVPTEGN